MFSYVKLLLNAILGMLGGITPKTWLTIFAVLSLFGAFLWFKHSIYQDCRNDEQAKANAAKVTALEKQLAEEKQYQAFLLDNQRKNEDFIKRQKRALKDANEKDGDVAPVLRGTFERLRNDRVDEK